MHFLWILLMMSSFSFAQKRLITVDSNDFSYTGTLSFKHDNAKPKLKDRDTTTFKFNVNYAESLRDYPQVMWKAALVFSREAVDYGSNDTLDSSMTLLGGAVFNFNYNDLRNSFFVSPMIGIQRATLELAGGDDQSGLNFLFFIEGGKRFSLGSYSIANVSYAPSISFEAKRYGGDIRKYYFRSGTDIRINFLRFDILF